MSYAIYLTTTDALGNDHDLYEVGNYTSNVAPMWTDALGESLRHLKDRKAADVLTQLEQAIHKMQTNPDHYRAMNPKNGWGDYEGALAYLQRLHEGCRRWPDGVIWISA